MDTMHSKHPLTDLETVGEMAGVMRLLGDPTRIRVLGLLLDGERNVSTLCGKLDLAQPTVSHHLGLLRTAGLVLTRRSGKQVFYSLNPRHLTTRPGQRGLFLTAGNIRMCLGAGDEGDRREQEPPPVTVSTTTHAGSPSAAAF